MSKNKKIVSLFPLTPEEQETLLRKHEKDTSSQWEREQMAICKVPAESQKIADLYQEASYENSKEMLSVIPSNKGRGLKQMAALISIICAMLIGSGITIAVMSNKNNPASGVSAVSETNTLYSEETSQKTSVHTVSAISEAVAEEISQENVMPAVPTVPRHERYSYADGVLTIKSDEYYISDYKEYMNLNDLKKVKIESGVTRIGSKSFNKCRNLSGIEIPDTVTYIGESAFEDCSSLTSVVLPEKLQTIEGYAFAQCTGLKNIRIPAGVSRIGHLAFSACSALASINVDENNLFFSSSDGVLFDKDQTILYKYPPAKSVSSYRIPDSVRYIGDHAFCVCKNLSAITLPDGVISVGDRGFASCINLQSINIPASVTHIGVWAFAGCLSLHIITIPYNVTDMAHSAFVKWTNEQTIVIQGRRNPPDTWDTNWNANCNAKIVWE